MSWMYSKTRYQFLLFPMRIFSEVSFQPSDNSLNGQTLRRWVPSVLYVLLFIFSTYILIMILQTTTRLQSTVIFLAADPSLLIPRDANTATLRLYTQIDYSDWRFLVEYREKSVLAGISSVGGFWTVVNGMYAVIFGMSLSYLLFGGRLALLYVVTS
jgi:hypothetical protein